MFRTTRRRVLQSLGIGGTAAVSGCVSAPDQPASTDGNGTPTGTDPMSTSPNDSSGGADVDVDRIAADPTDVPAPIDREEPIEHDVTLRTEEATAEIEPGVTFDYMTFGGRVPGPMIRVRRGDTVNLTIENPEDSNMPHNVDFHAVYGTGGGAAATNVNPGESEAIRFRAEYPGAYIYHCAVPNLDYHISAGMFGMILVEPEDGLPEVDREFYLGQHELYTDTKAGEEGHHGFNFGDMRREAPTYVVFNGEKYPFTEGRYGKLSAEKGETVRVFLVTGGPNVTSNFHPIGNVWTEAWPNGALASRPDEYVQTMKVAPGSCFVGTMDTPVPETIKLVDHALSRVARKGLLAEVEVEGEPDPDIYDPDP
jgi:nitrite reductase (NO-forming)